MWGCKQFRLRFWACGAWGLSFSGLRVLEPEPLLKVAEYSLWDNLAQEC